MSLYYAPNTPNGKSGYTGYPPEIEIGDMAYFGYALEVAGSNTFLRFIVNLSRLLGSPIPMPFVSAGQVFGQKAMKPYHSLIRIRGQTFKLGCQKQIFFRGEEKQVI
jgi:hypothetical protein